MSTQEQYNELAFYTLALGDSNFIHQHAVDAFTAQTADEHTKPIAIYYALAGLYLLTEKNFTGRQVQQAHTKMSRGIKQFPSLHLPVQRGTLTAKDVLAAAPGAGRDAMIYRWCSDVWAAYAGQRQQVVDFTEALLNY